MTAKAALIDQLLKGKVVNIFNGFVNLGITNVPREVSRCVEQPFSVVVTRTYRSSVSRYGQAVHWVDYSFCKKSNPKKSVQNMIDYVNAEKKNRKKAK